mgnify:CR=1 FL=1
MRDKTPINEDGQWHGHWEIYYDNGQLELKGLFVHNKRHGFHERYRTDGKLIWKGHRVNNEPFGFFEYNSVFGKLTRYYAQ